MPELTRPDGATIHWEAMGEGPTVVMSPAVFGNRDMFTDFVADVSNDHTVVRYDARGTGLSSRTGPHDLDTGADDLGAVIEAAGAPAVVISFIDATNRAVRLAARKPELVLSVVAGGVPPFSRSALEGVDAMAASDTVVDTFFEMIDSYYASALRQVAADANPQATEEEIRERVETQLGYCPQEVASARLRAWTEDDALSEAQAIDRRLVLVSWPGGGRPWFPDQDDIVRLVEKFTPEARLHLIENGFVSRPDLGAAIVRELTADLREPAIEA
jgi:pimeloyl-ACP methyl ester carboxylesterase